MKILHFCWTTFGNKITYWKKWPSRLRVKLIFKHLLVIIKGHNEGFVSMINWFPQRTGPNKNSKSHTAPKVQSGSSSVKCQPVRSSDGFAVLRQLLQAVSEQPPLPTSLHPKWIHQTQSENYVPTDEGWHSNLKKPESLKWNKFHSPSRLLIQPSPSSLPDFHKLPVVSVSRKKFSPM